MATKEKINLLEVIPCRNENIKADRKVRLLCSPFLVLSVRG